MPRGIHEVRFDWTDEMVEKLQRLNLEGFSCSEIATRLGDVSRNAVIGKLNRMSIKKTDKRTPRIKRPTRIYEKPPTVPLPQSPPSDIEPLLIDGKPVTLMMLTERMCRFPIGDPKSEDFHFCANRRKPGSNYCESHHAIAFQPPRPHRATI